MSRAWYSVDRSGVDALITDIITQHTEPLEVENQDLRDKIAELEEELQELKDKYDV